MRATAAVPLALAGGWSLPAVAPLAPRLADALGIRTRTAAPGTVGLTFDDGPHPQGTPAVLEALSAAGARATFFLVGEQVRRSPAIAAELAAAGHAIAVHGDRHRNLLRLPPRAVSEDLDRAAATIAGATGTTPVLHRPPYGIYSWPALAAVRARGWAPVLWSRWGRDWRRFATPAGIAAKVADRVRAGDVLLLHDGDQYSAPGSWRATVAALPRVVETVAASGLTFVPLTSDRDLAQPSGR